MKIKHLDLIVIFIALAAVIGFVVVKKHKSNSTETVVEEEKDDRTLEYESGDQLFCNYLLPQDWPQDSFFSEMVDVYNTFVVLHGMMSVKDAWMRIESSELAMSAIDKVDLDIIKSNEIRSLVSDCLEKERKMFSMPFEEVDSTIFFTVSESLYNLDSIMASRYNVSNYVDLSDEYFWQEMGHSAQTKDILSFASEKKITHDNINSKKVQKDIARILKNIDNEKDFENKCAYAMAYIYYVGFYNYDMDVIEALLDDGRYSPRLYFLWRIWRCAVQLRDSDYGPSTWSPIPNKLYNDKRYKIAQANLKYLVDHRDDAIAVNQFLMTAGQTNIMRFGQFDFGNESFTEVFYLGLMDDEDEDEDE